MTVNDIDSTPLKVGTKIHTHVRAKTQYSNGRPIDENIISHEGMSPNEALNSVKKGFKFLRYAETYSHDVDGKTEYLILTGVTTDNFRLTVNAFSCYCEPLNENQEPPF